MTKANGSRARQPLRLEDIPFEETWPDEPPAPAVAALLSGDAECRRAAWHYWVKTPLEGSINTVFHDLLRLLPSRFATAFGRSTADLGRWRYRNRIFAQRIARNFHALSPAASARGQGNRKGLHRWWRNIGATVAEFSRANDLWSEGNISLSGRENLAAAQKMGTPLIFVSMHLGTWEAAFTAIHQDIAPPSTGPFQPEPSRFINRIVYRLRKRRNQYLFPPGQRSAIRLHRLLTGKSASMTIFIDEVQNRQVHLPLFGRSLPEKGNAVVAIKLANASGGTIIPFYMKRIKGSRFELRLLPPLRPQPDGPRYKVAETLHRLNDVFEPVVLENIEHWYMLGELRLPQDFESGAYASRLKSGTAGDR
jgi:lauroyl/myristoyl acyltransferase